jgi:hypothetical protein
MHDEHVLVLYMSEDCSDTSPAGLAGVHHHKPDDGVLQLIDDAFNAASKQLHVEQVCIPHYTQLALADPNNRDPDCNALDDHVYIRRLKARYFAPWRRGIYRFAVMAHGTVDQNITGLQQADGVCTSTTGGRAGHAEITGDDMRIAHQYAQDRVGGVFPAVDHVAETHTLFHELAHTFGLNHVGTGSLGGNSKPNYQSAINYRYDYGMKGRDAFGQVVDVVDLSHVPESTLNETELHEQGASVFVSALPVADQRRMTWTCPDRSTDLAWPDGNDIDWNCDGVFDTGTVSVSIDGDGTLETLLEGTADWDVLKPPFCGNGTDWDDQVVGDEPVFDHRTVRDIVEATVDVVPGTCSIDPVSTDDAAPLVVVLHGSTQLDIAALDRRTIRLAGAAPRRVSVDDVDGDGLQDLRMLYRPSAMPSLRAASSTALFNARLTDGTLVHARPSVTPGTYLNTDGDRVVDDCDLCPTVAGSGDDGC